MPFFDVHAGGNGAIIAIGWSGGWRADFSRKGDEINIKTGLQNAEFYLKDGEKIRTSYGNRAVGFTSKRRNDKKNKRI